MKNEIDHTAEKIMAMLTSNDEEMKNLGFELCKQKYPLLWCAFVGYTGRISDLNEEMIMKLASLQHYQIGTNVRVKGLKGSPEMVVTNLEIEKINSSITVSYATWAKCTFFNKSKQEFAQVRERVECLEIINEPLN